MTGQHENWQITMKLTVLTHFLLEQLLKQAGGATANDAAAPGTVLHR